MAWHGTGSPGHYWAYLRDQLKEGVWQPQKIQPPSEKARKNKGGGTGGASASTSAAAAPADLASPVALLRFILRQAPPHPETGLQALDISTLSTRSDRPTDRPSVRPTDCYYIIVY
jgi:hypothetical protein